MSQSILGSARDLFLRFIRKVCDGSLRAGGMAFGFALGLMVASYTVVTAHECSHVIAARAFGLRTTDVDVTMVPYFSGDVQVWGINWHFKRAPALLPPEHTNERARQAKMGGVTHIPGVSIAHPITVSVIAFAGAYGVYVLGIGCLFLVVKVHSMPKSNWWATVRWDFLAAALATYAMGAFFGVINWFPEGATKSAGGSVRDGQVIAEQLTKCGVLGQITWYSIFAGLVLVPFLLLVWYGFRLHSRQRE